MSEIVFEVLCAEVLEALRGLGLGKFSIRNYYYEGMRPIIKAGFMQPMKYPAATHASAHSAVFCIMILPPQHVHFIYIYYPPLLRFWQAPFRAFKCQQYFMFS